MTSDAFIRVKGTLFNLHGETFPVKGLNCYFLAFCGPETQRAVLEAAIRMGSTVVRTWAFLGLDNFRLGQVAFQYFENGRIVVNHGPDGLQRLDSLIQIAEQLGIKLILPLVNYWADFGGMPAYVRWLGSSGDVVEFYRNPVLRAAYQDYVNQVLTRRNTLTGRLYSAEPAIMAWELTNEARFPPIEWIEEMSDFVKARDPNHLLALGDEGFFTRKRTGHLYNGTYGVDWEKNLSLTNMDFGTFHFYPQDWGCGDRLYFGSRWIRDHMEVGRALNKPVLLEEFGIRPEHSEKPVDRRKWYARWMKASASGSLVWMLGHDSPETSGFKDEFVIYEASHFGQWLAQTLNGGKR